MAGQNLIDRLRAGGIVSPEHVVAEAQRAGLPIEIAAALLDKESGGGHNVFGHDRDRSGRYIFPARDGTVKVTEQLYREYKRKRVASKNTLMQGVGPCQLTWWEFQDQADREGGCWKPEVNMRVGFRHLAALVRAHGAAVGARMYNGSGPAAVAYSQDLLRRAAGWKARLDGAAAPPVRPGVRALRLGDRGPQVVRATRRLARARSRSTGKRYLASPRRTFDAATEAALKAFQADHGLEADGLYGPRSQRKLNRVLALQARREEQAATAKPAAEKPATTKPATAKPATAKPATAKPARAGLKSLVGEVHRLDAETAEAWERLVAHAARRRRLLAQAKAKAKSGEPALAAAVAEGFAAVTAALGEIDETLDALVEGQVSHTAPAAAVSETTVAGNGPSPESNGPPREGGTPAGTGAGGASDGAEVAAATQTATAPTATVVQAAPPPPPPPEGAAPPTPVAPGPADRPARALSDLSDQELLERIERLDRALDRSRAVLIRRYAAVERALVELAPPKAEPKPEPAAKPKPRPKPKAEAEPKPKPKPEPAAKPEDIRPRRMSRDQIVSLQKSLNAFTEKYLKSVGPLMVDGVVGPATRKRIREAKHYLGYPGTAGRSGTVNEEFLRRLRQPRSARHASPRVLARGAARRRKQRRAAKASLSPRPGVSTFDGKPVAAWLKPYLVWARNNGWQGSLNSGWRDPAYSEQLCRNICGAPSCPGRCAGRSSNHAGHVKPAGAVDVSDYARFAELMRRCPLQPRIFNALGAQDPVHFSASGR